jgi:hypothetical protein
LVYKQAPLPRSSLELDHATTGALVFSTFYGSPSASGQYGLSAIALDSKNNVYIANLADGAGDLPLANGLQNYTSGVSQSKLQALALLSNQFYPVSTVFSVFSPPPVGAS